MKKPSQVYLVLEWKSFNVDLSAMEKWLRNNAGEHYCGCQSSDKGLEIGFDRNPGQEVKDAIQKYWDGIRKTHVIAKNYVSKADIGAAVEAAKQDMLNKPSDQWSVVQKKLWLNMEVSKEDLDS